MMSFVLPRKLSRYVCAAFFLCRYLWHVSIFINIKRKKIYEGKIFRKGTCERNIYDLTSLYRLWLRAREMKLRNIVFSKSFVLLVALRSLGHTRPPISFAEQVFPRNLSSGQNPHQHDEFGEVDEVLLDRMRVLQFETPLEDAKFLVAKSDGLAVGASIVRVLLHALYMGWVYDRTVVFDTAPSPYEFCFEAVTSHSLEDANKGTRGKMFDYTMQKEKTVCFEGGLTQWQIYDYDFPDVNLISPLRHLPYAQIYFDGLLLGRFLKLKDEYRTHIEERKRELGFAEEPVIGIHIRRGDHPFYVREQKYFKSMERAASEMGIRKVFVTSDSETIIRRLPKDSGVMFVYDDREKRYDNDNASMVWCDPGLIRQETMAAIKNIYLLGECDCIIGTESNFFFHAMALSYFRKKKLNGIRLMEHDAKSLYYRCPMSTHTTAGRLQ